MSTKNAFKTIKTEATEETVIEKSRFISYALKAETEEDAKKRIAEIKKLHPFATHNCYAYSVENGTARKFSDDGEPQGTAGQPIYDVLLNSSAVNAVIVVTRYFGGIKLGAGGLVRAYTGAAKRALSAAGISEFILSDVFSAAMPYELLSVAEKFFASEKCAILNKEYGDKVVFTVAAPKDGDFREKFADFTAGKIELIKTGEKYEEYQ